MREEALLKRITVNPEIMLGKPVIRGTRLPVDLILEKLAYGETVEDLLEDYPFISKEDVQAALLYAARCVSHEEIYLVSETPGGDQEA